MDEEAIVGEVLPIAQCARNNGGLVIAQVERLLEAPAPPHAVVIPGVLIDHVVVAPREDGQHDQTFGERFNPTYCSARGGGGGGGGGGAQLPAALEGKRRTIAARACDELREGDVVNLGIGIPEGVGIVAAERGVLDSVCLTIESGPVGGLPASGLSFGASAFPDAILSQPEMFDSYDGGWLDLAALGAAQIDYAGNVNVSRFGDTVAGLGGFVNISQAAKRLVFCCNFDAGSGASKFVPQVEQRSFSARRAAAVGTNVLYVTERCVLKLQAQQDAALDADGFPRTRLELREVALGFEVEDVLRALGQGEGSGVSVAEELKTGCVWS